MGKTKISWTDMVWNPVTGCEKVSTGCKHCYAERLFPRVYGKDLKFTDVKLHPERLDQPMHWRKPRMIFVNSMSDMFHEKVPSYFIDHIITIMSATPQHVYQILTKRPHLIEEKLYNGYCRALGPGDYLRNVWLGTSCENQETADERIPHLLECPATVRFLSLEPLLGEIDLRLDENPDYDFGIDWVIIGPDSGPKARHMQLEWARSIIDQCKAASVPVFVKQLCKNGGKIPFEDWPEDLKIREFPATGV